MSQAWVRPPLFFTSHSISQTLSPMLKPSGKRLHGQSQLSTASPVNHTFRIMTVPPQASHSLPNDSGLPQLPSHKAYLPLGSDESTRSEAQSAPIRAKLWRATRGRPTPLHSNRFSTAASSLSLGNRGSHEAKSPEIVAEGLATLLQRHPARNKSERSSREDMLLKLRPGKRPDL